jgi:hypothetical protein
MGRRSYFESVRAGRETGSNRTAVQTQVRECEEDVPTEQAQAQEDAWFQGAHEHARGEVCAEAQTLEGP